jgi:signal transduction histidine kinase/ActR/RegA family two-component response regulator
MSPRAEGIFRADLSRIVQRTDRMFFWLLLGQWLFGIAIALVWSPRTWIAQYWSVHQHVIVAACLGALFLVYPLFCILRLPGTRYTRHVIAIGQMLQSALLVHVTGGRIETHFHVFGSLALLAFYRDWRVLLTASAVVYLDHLALGIWFPLSVYGVAEASFWRSAEHAFWVIFEVVFLVMACRTGIRELAAIADRQAEIETVAADLRKYNAEIEAMSGQLKEANEDLETRVLERTQSLIQAREAKLMAEAASRAKDEFLSRMSHELRTPLNAILGFAQLLEMNPLDEDQGECVAQISRGGKHLLALINEVLDIARIESGRTQLSPEPVRVADAFQEVLDLVRPLGAGRGIRFQVDAEGINGHCVLADNQKLKQVLMNLLSNAVKYNRDGGEVRLSCEASGAGRLRLEVADTGAGIAVEKLSRLFVPFDRLGAEQTGVEGSGLGLALSKSLVELMGGTLTVASEPGRGTRFCVELAEAEDPQWQVAAGETPPGPVRPPCAARTVLYIEDNRDNLRLVQRILDHRPGVHLITAMQGSLGTDLARQHRPDLILLDVHLADLDGAQVLDRLGAAPETCSIPVVVLSADATPRQIERLRTAGARDYLTKPIDVPRLLGIVDEMLTQQKAVS